jgi:hypothetical protein
MMGPGFPPMGPRYGPGGPRGPPMRMPMMGPGGEPFNGHPGIVGFFQFSKLKFFLFKKISQTVVDYEYFNVFVALICPF